MPDAKSLLPGRAFRSEHAQLRPEPHSIASHGPAPMDPLQTTRMRNGVLYAAEWPCCHDPLRLSLGSEDPFYIHNPRVRRARLRTPPPGWARPPRAPSACASPARGEACAQRKSPSQQPLPGARALRRARAGLPRRPSARVCPSLHAAPPPTLFPLPNLLDVSFAFAPVLPLATPNAGKAFFTPASTLPSLYSLPTCQQPAHRVRAPAPRPRTPPAHTHAHRSPAP